MLKVLPGKGKFKSDGSGDCRMLFPPSRVHPNALYIPLAPLRFLECSSLSFPGTFGRISMLQPAPSSPRVDQHAAHISLSTRRCRGRQPLMRIVKVRGENVVVSKFQGELIREDSAPSDVPAGCWWLLNTSLETHCTQLVYSQTFLLGINWPNCGFGLFH